MFVHVIGKPASGASQVRHSTALCTYCSGRTSRTLHLSRDADRQVRRCAAQLHGAQTTAAAPCAPLTTRLMLIARVPVRSERAWLRCACRQVKCFGSRWHSETRRTRRPRAFTAPIPTTPLWTTQRLVAGRASAFRCALAVSPPPARPWRHVVSLQGVQATQ